MDCTIDPIITDGYRGWNYSTRIKDRDYDVYNSGRQRNGKHYYKEEEKEKFCYRNDNGVSYNMMKQYNVL